MASSNYSPLPAPQPVELQPMDQLMLAAANAVNGGHPEIVAGVGGGAQNLNDAVTNTQAAAQVSNVQQQAQQLQEMTAKDQQQYWDSFTASQQAQFRSIGYKPPAPHRSLWGDVVHSVEHPVSTTTHAIGDVFNNRPVHDVLNAFGAPLRAVQHFERAAVDAQAFLGHDSIKNFFNLSDWAKGWNQTQNGESFIAPNIQQQALAKWGPQTYNLAYELATGKTPQDLYSQLANDPNAQQALVQQVQSKPVQDAIAFLNSGHLSPGRAILPHAFSYTHPGLFNFISGSVDALFDIGTDPTLVGGKMAGEAAKFKYMVRSGDDVQRLYDGSRPVQDMFGKLAAGVRAGEGGMNDLLSTLNLTNAQKFAAQQLVAAQADTQEKVLAYFKDAADGASHLGLDTNYMAGDQLPRLTVVGRARLAAKGQANKAIDWMAEHELKIPDVDDDDVTKGPGIANKVGHSLALGTGKFAKMATTLVNQGGVFDPHAPDAANVLRDIAREFLPRQVADKYVYDFAQHPDIAYRWRLFRNLMIDMANSAGFSDNPALRDEWIGKFDSTYGRLYAKGDEMMGDGELPRHVGVLKNHMADRWAVPRYKDLVIQGRKAAGTHSLTGAINAEWMDKYMNMWRPLTLAHPGFAIRVGGEETLGELLRNGPVSYLRAAAARSYARTTLRAENKANDILDEIEGEARGPGEEPAPITPKGSPNDLTDNKLAEIWNLFTSNLPAGVRDGLSTIGDMMRENIVSNVHRAMEGTAQALTPDAYRRAVELHLRMENDDDILHKLSAMEGYEGKVSGVIDGQRFVRGKVNGKWSIAEIKPTGEYKMYGPGDDYYYEMWYRALHEIATDPWGRVALSKFPPGARYPKDFNARVRAVADRLEEDPDWKKMSPRSGEDRQGRLVAAGQITQRQAAEDHAKVIINAVDSVVRGPKGGELPVGEDEDLTGYLLREAKPPTIQVLKEIEYQKLPWAVKGPDVVPTTTAESKINRATGWLFKHQIGPQINWMSRQPMYWHAYSKAVADYSYRDVQNWRDAGMSDEEVDKLLHENSQQRALENVIKYVHNPELRSQMSTVTRNLSPFWFAQEQFYKRWARTFKYAPDAIRKAQLLSSGVRHSGLVSTDPESGQEYFVYPGSNLVQSVLTEALSHVGIHSVIPVSAGLTGQVNMLNPGLERVGLPQWGPLLSIPMDGLKHLDPHMTAIVDKIQGGVAANESALSLGLPSNVVHMLQAASGGQLGAQAQLASAQMQAIQYLEATGHGMGTPAVTEVTSKDIPDPQPGDYVLSGGIGSSAYVYQPDGKWQLNNSHMLQHYLTRVQNWSRIFLVTRALFGFAAPAAPESQFDPNGMDNQLKTLMNQLPFNQAIASFLQEHPQATALTVFQSQSQTGSTLPATTAAMKFLDDNPQLVNNHTLAATYFIPQPDTSGKYSLAAYQEQVAEGLRQRKDPKTFYDQVVYQGAAQVYFQVENEKNQMIAQGGNTRTIQDEWTQWSEAFQRANPIFADYLGQSGTPGVVAASQAGRQQIMEDVGAALNDGSAPQNAQTSAIAALYDTWQQWQTMTGNFGNPNSPPPSSSMILTIDEEFATWLANFEAQNPGVTPLVERAIRPDLSQALTDLAQQGTVITL